MTFSVDFSCSTRSICLQLQQQLLRDVIGAKLKAFISLYLEFLKNTAFNIDISCLAIEITLYPQTVYI